MPNQEELQQRFSELRMETVNTLRAIKQMEEEILVATNVSKKSELTHGEISRLPDDTKLYLTVGRAFLMQPRATILNSLEQDMSSCKTQIARKQEQKEMIQGKLKASEEALRTLVKQK